MRTKPLDFIQEAPTYWKAKVFEFGSYRVYDLGGTWRVSFFGYSIVSTSLKIKNAEHGMALAQAHYERVVASALTDDGNCGTRHANNNLKGDGDDSNELHRNHEERYGARHDRRVHGELYTSRRITSYRSMRRRHSLLLQHGQRSVYRVLSSEER